VKAKDLRTGVVYSYRQGTRWADARPVAVLDTTGLYRRTRTGVEPGQPYDKRPTGGSSTFGYSVGYLAASYEPGSLYGHPDDPSELLAFTVADALAAEHARLGPERTTMGEVFGRPGEVRVRPVALLIDPRWVEGPWDEVRQAKADAAEVTAAIEADRKAASDARLAAARARTARLRALGLPGQIDEPQEWYRSGDTVDTPGTWAGNTGKVVLTAAQADALLSLIPDGAAWTPADTEDDGWTLARPHTTADAR
jgi:hypothetical protein